MESEKAPGTPELEKDLSKIAKVNVLVGSQLNIMSF